MASTAKNRTRVILHVDLDAFYCTFRSIARSPLPLVLCSTRANDLTGHCNKITYAGQVEMKRVGIPAHVPCAVQQWEGLIAGGLLASTCSTVQLTQAARMSFRILEF